VWNDAEAPEPPANLTATLKGAVIHRFAKRFAKATRRGSLARKFRACPVDAARAVGGQGIGIDDATAVADLLPLAQNYLASEVFRRVQDAARINIEENSQFAIRNAGSPAGQPGGVLVRNPPRPLERTAFSSAPAAGDFDGHNRQTANHVSRKRFRR